MSCFSVLKDRHAWPGADGRSREDHDAEWGHVWHLHGHRYGHPLLRRQRTDQLHKTTSQLWDSSSGFSHSSRCARCCHTLIWQISFVNKIQIYQMFFRVDIPLCDAWSWQTLKRKQSQREIFQRTSPFHWIHFFSNVFPFWLFYNCDKMDINRCSQAPCLIVSKQ